MSPVNRSRDEATVLRTADGRVASTMLVDPGGAESANALPVGTRLSEFEITGLIGGGGFGIVYRAFDHSLEREVALKEYMPAAVAVRQGGTVLARREEHIEAFEAGLRSFVNEAHLLAKFDHPSLVKVYRFWEANGTAYFVMPFYDGLTLKAVLASRGQAPDEAWLFNLLRPLLDALALLHRDNCFHRDIAPDNILMLQRGRPLLLDFGAARQTIGDLTQALTAILKPGYAPIEQYAEIPGLTQGPWTDLYALAAVVYYAINGRAPVPSAGRVLSDTLPPLARTAAGRYSDRFLRGIDRALSVKPEDRPQNVAQFAELIGLAKLGPEIVPPDVRRAPPELPTVVPPPHRLGSTQRQEPSRRVATVRDVPPPQADEAATARAPRSATRYIVLAILLILCAAAALMLRWRQPAVPVVPPGPESTLPTRPDGNPVPDTTVPTGTTGPQSETPPAKGEASTPSGTPADGTTDAKPPSNTGPTVVTPPKADSTPLPPPASPEPEPPAPPAPKPEVPAAQKTDAPPKSNMADAGKSAKPANKIRPKAAADAGVCRDLTMRATLGEPLSPAEKARLKEDC